MWHVYHALFLFTEIPSPINQVSTDHALIRSSSSSPVLTISHLTLHGAILVYCRICLLLLPLSIQLPVVLHPVKRRVSSFATPFHLRQQLLQNTPYLLHALWIVLPSCQPRSRMRWSPHIILDEAASTTRHIETTTSHHLHTRCPFPALSFAAPSSCSELSSSSSILA